MPIYIMLYKNEACTIMSSSSDSSTCSICKVPMFLQCVFSVQVKPYTEIQKRSILMYITSSLVLYLHVWLWIPGSNRRLSRCVEDVEATAAQHRSEHQSTRMDTRGCPKFLMQIWWKAIDSSSISDQDKYEWIVL